MSICELICPLIFALLVFQLKTLSGDTYKPVTSYLNEKSGHFSYAPDSSGNFPNNYKSAIEDHWVRLHNIIPMKACTTEYFGDQDFLEKKSGKIGLGPKSSPIAQKLETFFTEVWNYSIMWVEDSEEVDSIASKLDYAQTITDGQKDQFCLAIIIEEEDSSLGKYTYNFHYNTSFGPIDDDVYDPYDEQVRMFEVEDETYWKIQLKSGFSYLQNLIDTIILQTTTGNNNAKINSNLVRIPTKAYRRNGFYATFSGIFAMYVVFPLAFIYLRFIYKILYEKEHKITENMRNMGMNMFTHHIAWLTWYNLIVFLSSIPWTILMVIGVFPDANFFLVWLLFFLTGTFMMSVGFLITTFFTKAKSGVLAGLIMFVIQYSVLIMLGNTNESTSESTFNMLALMSPFAGMGKAGGGVCIIQGTFMSYNFSVIGTLIAGFRYRTFVIITLLETILCYLAGLWVDQILPSEFGVKKHPLFCFGFKHKVNSISREEKEVTLNNRKHMNKAFFDEPDETLKIQKNRKQSIEIENLFKVYKNGKKAVNNLNLSMYSGQIFALLGHNGAGKTTTISMMSGLLEITKGTIRIKGLDSKADMDKIKQILGVCPQTNPIYPSLTCKEHLTLYSKLKNNGKLVDGLNDEIDEILRDIDLLDKKDYKAGKLSGGQKRKLCVAISFIGGSEVVLLDEPTSGMDTYARRKLWDMLKKYKQNKIIILTTHYMDEADYLGDRVGIMGEGHLLTCGTSMFLKKQFGVGYNLTIVKNNSEVSTQTLTSTIQNYIPSSKLKGDIGKEVKFQLLEKETDKFENLFRTLEDNKTQLGIQSFGISLTTLEEVFLKVIVNLGHQEEVGAKKEGLFNREEVSLKEIRVKKSSTLFCIHFWALLKKRMIYFKRDYKSLICEIILPIIVVVIGISLTLISFLHGSPDAGIVPSFIGDSYNVWINNNLDSTISQSIKGYSAYKTTEKTASSVSDFNQLLQDTIVPSRFFSLYFETVDNTNKEYTYYSFFNSSVPHSIHISINQANQAILRTALANPNAEINVNLKPFKFTENMKGFENLMDGVMSVFFLCIAFAFMASSMIMFIVKERQTNVKHQQIVSGVSIPAYWLSNFVVDYIKFIIISIVILISSLIFDVNGFKQDDHYSMSISLLVVFGPAFIAFTYVTSFIFKSPASAQVFTFILNFFFGYILTFIVYIFRIVLKGRSLDVFMNTFEWIFRLSPIFNYIFGMFSMSSSTAWLYIFSFEELPAAWSWYGALKELIMCILITILYIILIFTFELWKGKKVKNTNKLTKKEIQIHKQLSLSSRSGKERSQSFQPGSDVEFEKTAVKNSNDYALKVENLRKTYVMIEGGGCFKGKVIKKKTAVKNIFFGVKKGECFGLLGTNGAGKTTTFKMLSGEIQPSEGTATIENKDVTTQMKNIRHLIGYCPQFDALLNLLTAREHLELFASIKGIPENMRESLIQDKLKQLNLTKYENVQAGTYSGGTKRKLSVAIALLGNPPIIFLDEPSSGMDPEARRFMWTVVSRISSQMKKSSVILTTHSMEEAEALSTKLAIMVDGEIKCIGPVQSLKDRYGKGFEIEVKLDSLSPQDIHRIVGETRVAYPTTSPGITPILPVLNRDQIKSALRKAGKDYLISEISPEGAGSGLDSELNVNNSVDTKLFFEFYHTIENSRKVQSFLGNEFGKVSILEFYNRNYRFKIEDNVKLSQLFGVMEKDKDKLRIEQYSIKQASIEQIFINFANTDNNKSI